MTRFKNSLLSSATSICIVALSQGAIALPYGYTQEGNIISDGSTEWLSWGSTFGGRIDQTLTEYEAQGWRLANSSEVANLFNDFGLHESALFTGQGQRQVIDRDDYGTEVDEFIDAFGITHLDLYDDQSAAVFAADDGSYGIASVFRAYSVDELFFDEGELLDEFGTTDLPSYYYENNARIDISGPVNLSSTSWWALSDKGVAFARDIEPEVSTVPLPAALPLFTSGVAFFGFLARRKKPSTQA